MLYTIPNHILYYTILYYTHLIQYTTLYTGEKVDVGKILVILEKGNLFGLKGIVSQKDKGRGK